jgi:hypothetical protein
MLHRIVEDQASHTPTRTITDNQDEYDFIENLVEESKPTIPATNHHYLIRTQFRYPLPVLPKYTARFRPPYFHKNVFYGAFERETSFYEAAYHWLCERVHIKDLSMTPEPRTHFTVDFGDSTATDICDHPDISKIMDRNDYRASHDFITKSPDTASIIYPSCRDPKNGKCAAVFDLLTLGERLQSAEPLHLIYNSINKSCTIIGPEVDPQIVIPWGLVA